MVRRSRSCIVTDEFLGINKKGGIGTCARGLAEALAAAGHRVEILITASRGTVANPRLLERFEVSFLPEIVFEDLAKTDPRNESANAYRVYLFLRDGRFDTIHFNDWMGSGFYVAMARMQGLLASRIVTHLHGSSAWVRRYNRNLPALVDFERERMERFQIEQSDLVIAPSRYLLDWYRGEGFVLPEAIRRQWTLPQWIAAGTELPAGLLETRPLPAGSLREVIFFGRQERRKGFEIFVEAVRALPPDVQPDITFVGAFSRIDHEFTGSFALRKLVDYGGRIRFLSDMDQEAALRFVRRAEGALCVMPSLVENSPCVVGECFTLGMPFLATDSGGTAELVDPASRAACLVAPEAKALAAAIARVSGHGLPALRSTLDPAAIIAEWKGYAAAIDAAPPPAPPEPVPTSGPTVSVCIAHYNRPKLLARALDAVARQTYESVEVIVVDDGSREAAALAYLDVLERAPYRFPLRVIRSENRYLGAARNLAASQATGEFLLFHDDDNYAEPAEIATFVAAAQRSGCDVLTAQYYVFDDGGDAGGVEDKDIRWFPLGIGGLYSFFHNRFGDANALFRTSVFRELGGFTELRGVGWEDWELFLKAHLRGKTLGVVPEPLFNYRISSGGMLQQGDVISNHDRLFGAIEEAGASVTADLMRFVKTGDIVGQQRERALRLVATLPAAGLHRELMDQDPQSETARARLADLAFSLGRTPDAIDIALQIPAMRRGLLSLDADRFGRQGIGAFRRHVSLPAGAAQDALLVQGWLIDDRNRPLAIGSATVDGKPFQAGAERRFRRPDVEASRGMPASPATGIVALLERSEEKAGFLRQRGRSFDPIAVSRGLAADALKVERPADGRPVGHVDIALWCRIIPLEIASGGGHAFELTIESGTPDLVAVAWPGLPLAFSEEVDGRRARFVHPGGALAAGAVLRIAAPNGEALEVMY